MTKTEKRSIIALVSILILEVISAVIIFANQPEPKVEHHEIPIVMDTMAVSDISEDLTQTAMDIQAEAEAEAEAQRIAEEEAARQAYIQQQQTQTYESTPEPVYSGNSFESDGVWSDGTYRYTWYSSNAAYHYRTPEWTAGSDGIYRDAEGYVVVASSDHPQGTVIESTPFGSAKVYDTGCASGTLDVYTNF